MGMGAEAVRKCAWRAFRDETLALYAPPIRRPATMKKMALVLAEFGALCVGPGDLTPATIAAWIAGHPGRRPATIDSYLRSLRAAIGYALERGYCEVSPFARRAPSAWVDWDAEELPPPVHTAAEITRVLELADAEASGGDWEAGRLRVLAYLLAYTGARKCEVLGLRVVDVDLVGGWLTIAPHRRRGLKTRASAARIPLAGPPRPVLEAWLPRTRSEWLIPGVWRRGPWLHGAPGYRPLDQLRELGQRAGVAGLTIASMRHTVASCAEGWGIGELMLQRLLRHTSIKTQRIYRHPLDGPLQAAAAKIAY